MKQVLVDLYQVKFNDVRTVTRNGDRIVVHETNNEEYIVLGKDDSIIVGEPYLVPLQKYGGGFKEKKLLGKNCCWVGSNIAARIANKGSSLTKSHSYRLVET